MKTYRQILEAAEKLKSSFQYVQEYMDNMFENGDVEYVEWGKFRFETWKDFFNGARNGAYDWSEDLEQPGLSYEQEQKINKIRGGILKLRDTKFSADKKLFKQIRSEIA